MKKQTLRLALMFSLLFVAATAQAQAQATRKVTVNIPFEFSVGEERLPAGEYVVKSATRYSDKALVVRSVESGRASSALIITSAVAPESKGARHAAKLEFRRYGDQFFLYRVWTDGHARQLSTSRRERTLRRELAKNAKEHDASQDDVVSVQGSLR